MMTAKEHQKDCFSSFTKRIKAATDDSQTLEKLETKIDKFYNLGLLSVHHYGKLDLMIFERRCKLFAEQEISKP